MNNHNTKQIKSFLNDKTIDQSIFDISPQAMIVIDRKGKILNVNNRLHDWLGYKTEEVIGKNMAQVTFLPLASKAKVMKKFAQRMMGKTVPPYDLVFLNNKGEERIGHIIATPVRDTEGKIIADLAMISEVTEQRDIERKLRENEEKYKNLYNSSQDAIMVLTLDEGFVNGNPATIKMFGCKDEQQFIQLSPADLSPDKQPDGSLSAVKAKEMMEIALKNGSHFFEWVHRRYNGEEFIASVLLTRIELHGKEALSATVRDITTQNQAEKRLKRFNKLMVGRELKIKELKEEIIKLKKSG